MPKRLSVFYWAMVFQVTYGTASPSLNSLNYLQKQATEMIKSSGSASLDLVAADFLRGKFEFTSTTSPFWYLSTYPILNAHWTSPPRISLILPSAPLTRIYECLNDSLNQWKNNASECPGASKPYLLDSTGLAAVEENPVAGAPQSAMVKVLDLSKLSDIERNQLLQDPAFIPPITATTERKVEIQNWNPRPTGGVRSLQMKVGTLSIELSLELPPEPTCEIIPSKTTVEKDELFSVNLRGMGFISAAQINGLSATPNTEARSFSDLRTAHTLADLSVSYPTVGTHPLTASVVSATTGQTIPCSNAIPTITVIEPKPIHFVSTYKKYHNPDWVKCNFHLQFKINDGSTWYTFSGNRHYSTGTKKTEISSAMGFKKGSCNVLKPRLLYLPPSNPTCSTYYPPHWANKGHSITYSGNGKYSVLIWDAFRGVDPGMYADIYLNPDDYQYRIEGYGGNGSCTSP